MIEIIDNHSVRTDLLGKRPVLDAGARGFRFSKWFAEHGHETWAIDPSPDMIGDVSVAHYDRAALVAPSWPNSVGLHLGPDPEAWYVVPGMWRQPGVMVKTLNLRDHWQGVSGMGCGWDVVKLNIEGAEYDILAEWPGPIARQITVSFHEHTDRRRGDAAITDIVLHLRKWYYEERHVKDERYCCGPNFWDSLFVLKELA